MAEGTVDEVVAASGIAGHGKIRISPDQIGVADAGLQASSSVSTIRYDNTRPGEFDVQLGTGDGARTALLRSLLDADIDVRAFDLQGARLSDAFLARTGASPGDGVEKR